MIPGLSIGAEPALLRVLVPEVTSLTRQHYAALPYLLMNGRDAESHALGLRHVGGPEIVIAVTDAARPVGAISVQTAQPGTLLFLDNRTWSGTLTAAIRVLGANCALIFNDIGDGFVAFGDVFLRSHRQVLFWGAGATAVGMSLEMQGDGVAAAIGDDALVSSGVWLRNHDMHALHDLASGARINRTPAETIIERHVWLGQDALLLGCERIGMGSVIGARALVRGCVPRHVIAAGIPARVLREGVSWGRDLGGISAAERHAIGADVVAPHPAGP